MTAIPHDDKLSRARADFLSALDGVELHDLQRRVIDQIRALKALPASTENAPDGSEELVEASETLLAEIERFEATRHEVVAAMTQSEQP